MEFFYNYLMYILVTVSIVMIATGVKLIYNYLYIGYHIRVSDTDVPYVNLKFKGHIDELDIYITDSGSNMYHMVTQSGYATNSSTYRLPDRYKTPYEYIMSGEIDDKIRDTRIATNNVVMAVNGYNIKKQQATRAHLENLPIKFHDVSHEIKRKLGLHKRI